MTLNLWADALFENGWQRNYVSRGTDYTTIGNISIPYTVESDIQDKYSSLWEMNATIGFLYDITEMATISGVFKTPWTAKMHHEYASSSFQRFSNSGPSESNHTDSYSEDVEMRFPMSYGLVIAFRFSDIFTCSLDVYRTEWGDFSYKDSKTGVKRNPIDGYGLAPGESSHVEPTHQVRVGGEYLIIRGRTIIPVRGGLFYDPEPGKNGSEPFYGFSVGSGVSYGSLVFDVAYQFRFGNDIDGGVLSYPNITADVRQHELLAFVICHS